MFTANSAESVQKGTKHCENYVKTHPTLLNNMAYTLGARREHLPFRSFALTNGLTSPVFSTPSKAPKAPPDVIFVFTGQGAQWATMGTRLMSDFPTALRDFELMDEALSNLPEPPVWTIRGETCPIMVVKSAQGHGLSNSVAGELHRTKETSRVDRAEFAQPLCTAIQVVVVNLLRTWGISPAAVVGHSSGEIAAAYASGALTLQEAIIVAYLRGLAFTKQQIQPGAMAAVGLGKAGVRSYLVDGVVIACENSPISITLSGDKDKIDTVVERIKHDSPDIFARRLRVEMAYHSRTLRRCCPLRP